jgi:glycosyltransferase involved in cell wall biosynthesis
VTVIGNGVDLDKFRPLPRDEARRTLDLPADARILISVGTLIERKGFHRVIACLPALLERVPNLHYLIIGGPGPAGDLSERLRAQVQAARLGAHVHFLGPYAPEQLRVPLSAADLFVLATSYEGWANVFLEAMACGLPIVTTRVGGNAEVVCSGQLGTLVDLHDQDALTAAIVAALDRQWDTEAIMAQARSNAWDDKVALLLDQLRTLVAGAAAGGASPEARSPEARS